MVVMLVRMLARRGSDIDISLVSSVHEDTKPETNVAFVRVG